MRLLVSTLCTLPLLLLAPAAWPQTAAPMSLAQRALAFELNCCSAPPGWNKAGAAALESQRGGFELPSGLTVSLGLERLVAVNGQLVSQGSFNITNLASLSDSEARQARDVLTGARLIQNGPGNFASLPAGPGTYVQNTLDGQTIAARTIINANVNSASLLKDLNFNASVRDAGLRALTTH